MVSSSSHAAPDGVESQLLDLGEVLLPLLRKVDSDTFHRAIVHVQDQAGVSSKTETSCSSLTSLD
jgi:hypothetical protein